MNVGCRVLEVNDELQGVRVPVHVLYPTEATPRIASFGPYSLEVAIDGPVAGDRLPVVAISHGNGGTPWAYRGLATHLAGAGFAVVLVEHPGNSRSDNSLAGTPANLSNRPRHLRLALDAAFDGFGARLATGRAAVIGHSIGGYTALAVAGGRPVALPEETPEGVARPLSVEPDPRVAAAVLFAPALPWYMGPGALADVRVPLFVRTGELDSLMPPDFVERILAGLSADIRMDYQVVPGAGHFGFQTPFPPAMVSPSFPPSQDPPGFDRVAYQAQLCAEVLGFLRDELR